MAKKNKKTLRLCPGRKGKEIFSAPSLASISRSLRAQTHALHVPVGQALSLRLLRKVSTRFAVSSAPSFFFLSFRLHIDISTASPGLYARHSRCVRPVPTRVYVSLPLSLCSVFLLVTVYRFLEGGLKHFANVGCRQIRVGCAETVWSFSGQLGISQSRFSPVGHKLLEPRTGCTYTSTRDTSVGEDEDRGEVLPQALRAVKEWKFSCLFFCWACLPPNNCSRFFWTLLFIALSP